MVRLVYKELLTAAYEITKTCLCNDDLLKSNFYIVKLVFTGYTLFFLISAQNIDCGYSLEPPRRGGSNEYRQSMFISENTNKSTNYRDETTMRTRQHETIEMLEQKKTNSKTPVGPTKDRASSTNQHYPKLNFK